MLALVGELLVQPHTLVVHAAPVPRHLLDYVVLRLRDIAEREQVWLADHGHYIGERHASVFHPAFHVTFQPFADIRIHRGIVLPLAIFEGPMECQHVPPREHLLPQSVGIRSNPRIDGEIPLASLELHGPVPVLIKKPHRITISSCGCHGPRKKRRGYRDPFPDRRSCKSSIRRLPDTPPRRGFSAPLGEGRRQWRP